jgi:hypothetical protein
LLPPPARESPRLYPDFAYEYRFAALETKKEAKRQDKARLDAEPVEANWCCRQDRAKRSEQEGSRPSSKLIRHKRLISSTY